jgi:hypothetical protein
MKIIFLNPEKLEEKKKIFSEEVAKTICEQKEGLNASYKCI